MSAASELAERALARARGETQVTVTRERSLMSRYARSSPTQATAIDDVTVHVLAFHEGHTGAAETNRGDDAALREACERAEAAARAAAAAAGGPGDHPGLPEALSAHAAPSGHHSAPSHHDPAVADLDAARAGAALAAAFEETAAASLEAFGVWTAAEVETAIATTKGLRATDVVTDAYMKIIARDARGRSGWAAGTATNVDAIDARALAREAAAKVRPGDAVELPPGEYPVVLAPDALGTLLDFLGDLAFNGLAHEEGRGALSGLLGTRVAAPAIALSDDPGHPLTLPRAFDAEGLPKRPIALLDRGVANAVVHDTRSAARAGAASTGHAIAPGGSPHGPVPTNLVLAPGTARSEAELAAPIERGIYVTRLWYVNPVHEREALLTGTTRDGTFLIEDGEIARPLRDVRFTDSLLRLLAATEALTAAQRLVCEGDYYGRRFAYGTVCPAIRTSGFRVTGVSPA